MVYLVQSNQSSKNLDNYLCAGALISQWQILTAAACLMELTHMYGIAGYKKYVNGRGVDYDECTRTKKNRVMKTCVPKDYNLSYTNRSMYVSLDIGVAFVEQRYDPEDITWLDDCSYIPRPIRISYAAELIEPGNDVVAFGWGGSFYRTPTDVLDNNSPFLQEISTLIISKERCKSNFKTYANNMWNAIDMYLVCVEGVGNLDGDGNMISIGSTSNSGCHRRDGSGCDRGDTRRKSGARHANNSVFHQPVPSRRQSLCQNDHGAPLITWMGSEEVLIGIGASSVVDAHHLFCMAPSLFTSTHCVGKVVECLTALTKENRRRCAEGIKTQGIGIQDINFDWNKMPEVPDADLDANDSDEEET